MIKLTVTTPSCTLVDVDWIGWGSSGSLYQAIFEASSSWPSGPRAGWSANSAWVIVELWKMVNLRTSVWRIYHPAKNTHQVTMLCPDVLKRLWLANHSQKSQEGCNQSCPTKEDKLHVLLTHQAQNRTTIPSKSGDSGHTLSLTGTATTMQPPWLHEDDLEVRKECLDDKLEGLLVSWSESHSSDQAITEMRESNEQWSDWSARL